MKGRSDALAREAQSAPLKASPAPVVSTVAASKAGTRLAIVIDSMSEIFNNSNAEIALAQDPFNRRLDRGRSSYDRPLRLAGNFVYELPFHRDQKGFTGHVLGGWQLNSNFNFQSGAPFSPLNPSDISGTLGGLAAAVGIATRPNVNTNLDDIFNKVLEGSLDGSLVDQPPNTIVRQYLTDETKKQYLHSNDADRTWFISMNATVPPLWLDCG